MNDKLGRPLHEGDRVATYRSGYVGILIGTVVGFTPKNVKVKAQYHENLRPPKEVVKL